GSISHSSGSSSAEYASADVPSLPCAASFRARAFFARRCNTALTTLKAMIRRTRYSNRIGRPGSILGGRGLPARGTAGDAFPHGRVGHDVFHVVVVHDAEPSRAERVRHGLGHLRLHFHHLGAHFRDA